MFPHLIYLNIKQGIYYSISMSRPWLLQLPSAKKLSNQLSKVQWLMYECNNTVIYCGKIEPRSYFISSLSRIVTVNVIPNRVVVDSDWRFKNLCCSHFQSQSELYQVS